MGVEPVRAGAERTHGRGPQRASGAPSGDAPVEVTRALCVRGHGSVGFWAALLRVLAAI